MVCSPEQAQLNGSKSKGAITDRGKAIASRNATKHGLLTNQPPILASEDLETFQGLIQSLIDQYKPQTPVEHLLIQQVAMCWQRLHRLWGVEAAIANLEMARLEKARRFPNQSLLIFGEKVERPEVAVELEHNALERLLVVLEDEISGQIPKRGLKKWCESEEADHLVKVLNRAISQAIEAFPQERLPVADELKRGLHENHIWSKLIRWECSTGEEWGTAWYVLMWTMPEIQQACQQRLEELKQALADLQRLEQAEQQAAVASGGIPQDIDKLSRYERHILRGLNDALDRIETVQQQRNNAVSIGSFRQISHDIASSEAAMQRC
ncbi:MAG TPA: hypothetical protein V6C84_12295 [Coleofasciculaceae cyanobacterium]|jgi:hypothetical protein